MGTCTKGTLRHAGGNSNYTAGISAGEFTSNPSSREYNKREQSHRRTKFRKTRSHDLRKNDHNVHFYGGFYGELLFHYGRDTSHNYAALQVQESKKQQSHQSIGVHFT